jgi:uncharacterized membrane protein YfcA
MRPRVEATPSEAVALSPATAMVVGFVTGLASTLTGTGGPVVLMPILLWLGVPLIVAIGLSQAIQLPIAILATVGNVAANTLQPPSMGIVLGLAMSIGAFLGVRLSHRLNPEVLRRSAAQLLVVVGVVLIAGALMPHFLQAHE